MHYHIAHLIYEKCSRKEWIRKMHGDDTKRKPRIANEMLGASFSIHTKYITSVSVTVSTAKCTKGDPYSVNQLEFDWFICVCNFCSSSNARLSSMEYTIAGGKTLYVCGASPCSHMYRSVHCTYILDVYSCSLWVLYTRTDVVSMYSTRCVYVRRTSVVCARALWPLNVSLDTRTKKSMLAHSKRARGRERVSEWIVQQQWQ